MPSDSLTPGAAGACRSLLGALLALGMVAGCAAPPPPPVPAPLPEPPVVVAPAPPPAVTSAPIVPPEVQVAAPVRPRNSPTDLLLAQADRLRALPPADLTAEIARYGEPEDPIAQAELALALLNTRVPADTARALGLLQRAQAGTTPEARAVQPLVRLLIARAGEQRRLEDQIDKQNQQMRDTQRRIDQLNERLEAMRAIERSLTAPRAPNSPTGAHPGNHGNGARTAP
ncbi:MAG: hypothetical protein KA795_00030 [Burkholderiaceae bacterium]|nr:hypothetical protein [Burkholderiaceae bacterium]